MFSHQFRSSQNVWTMESDVPVQPACKQTSFAVHVLTNTGHRTAFDLPHCEGWSDVPEFLSQFQQFYSHRIYGRLQTPKRRTRSTRNAAYFRMHGSRNSFDKNLSNFCNRNHDAAVEMQNAVKQISHSSERNCVNVDWCSAVSDCSSSSSPESDENLKVQLFVAHKRRTVQFYTAVRI